MASLATPSFSFSCPSYNFNFNLKYNFNSKLANWQWVGRGPRGGGKGSCVRRQICVATRQNCKTSTSNSSQVLSVPGTNSAALSSPYLSLSLPLLLFLLSGYYKFAISLLPFLQPSLMSFLCLLLAALL